MRTNGIEEPSCLENGLLEKGTAFKAVSERSERCIIALPYASRKDIDFVIDEMCGIGDFEKEPTVHTKALLEMIDSRGMKYRILEDMETNQYDVPMIIVDEDVVSEYCIRWGDTEKSSYYLAYVTDEICRAVKEYAGKNNQCMVECYVGYGTDNMPVIHANIDTADCHELCVMVELLMDKMGIPYSMYKKSESGSISFNVI